MINPYDPHTVNPDLCYGRDRLLSDLLSGLPGSPRNSYGVAGGRRMGKSTVLRKVEKDLLAGIPQWKSGGLLVIPIYIDGLELPQPLNATDVWSFILKELSKMLPVSEITVVDFFMFKEIIRRCVLTLPERPRIIAIFDEIEPITICKWSGSFFSHWRSLLSNTPQLSEFFTAVFAGARDMDALRNDVTSPLKDILEWRSLRSLEYDDVCCLAQEPIKRQWSEDFLDKLYAETGGHPMLVQYLMQKICNQEEDVAEQVLVRAAIKFETERSWQFSQWWERYCTADAQRIYGRFPDNNESIDLSTIVKEFGLQKSNDALEILQHVGLANSGNEGFDFRYAGEMFHRWYKKFGILSEQPQHDLEIYTRLNHVDKIAADKYLSAWKIYQQEIPNYSGVLVEVRGILEIILSIFAPKNIVQCEVGFKPESDRSIVTLRQQVRYLARRLYGSDRVKEIVSDYNLLEIAEQQVENLADAATRAHRGASAMAHETATRDIAYRALKQWDGLLAQLLADELYQLPRY